MSESSAGDRQIAQVLHWVTPNDKSYCGHCGKELSPLDHVTDEAVLFHNPPEQFISCAPVGYPNDIIDVSADDKKPEVEEIDTTSSSGVEWRFSRSINQANPD